MQGYLKKMLIFPFLVKLVIASAMACISSEVAVGAFLCYLVRCGPGPSAAVLPVLVVQSYDGSM